MVLVVVPSCVTAVQVSKPPQENFGCADSFSSSSSMSSLVGELSLCAVLVASSISVNAPHHCIVAGPSPAEGSILW